MCDISDLDFSSFSYLIARTPTSPKLRAWSKLRECERRLVFYRWVKGLKDVKTRYRTLHDDAVSTFLLSFEVTLQFMKDQFQREASVPDFDSWVKALAEHDLIVRGVRTLRLLEAHVMEKPTGTVVPVQIAEDLPSGRSETSVGPPWYTLSVLQKADLDLLDSPRLKESELPLWNAHVGATEIDAVFDDALHQLKKILDQAEAVMP